MKMKVKKITIRIPKDTKIKYVSKFQARDEAIRKVLKSGFKLNYIPKTKFDELIDKIYQDGQHNVIDNWILYKEMFDELLKELQKGKNKPTVIEKGNMRERLINWLIKKLKVDTNKISDGYHTFEELYTHRIQLWIALCRKYPNLSWRSRKHSDGSIWKGWFIMGMNQNKYEQITYHLPIKYWHTTNDFKTIGKAYKFDGHTPEDVCYRIANLYSKYK